MPPVDIQSVSTLYSAEEIASRIEALAGEIAKEMPDDIVVIAILKGGFVFAADLIRALHGAGMCPRVDFMTLSSYGTAKQSSGTVTIARDISDDIEGADILLVDDILESGRTVAAARKLLLDRGARSVKICMLLDKPGKRKVECEADFCGFVVPDLFVVGFGLDYAHYYRDLPFIGTIDD